jgi:hypothetical protein
MDMDMWHGHEHATCTFIWTSMDTDMQHLLGHGQAAWTWTGMMRYCAIDLKASPKHSVFGYNLVAHPVQLCQAQVADMFLEAGTSFLVK